MGGGGQLKYECKYVQYLTSDNRTVNEGQEGKKGPKVTGLIITLIPSPSLKLIL